jgi:hypothetical protein
MLRIAENVRNCLNFVANLFYSYFQMDFFVFSRRCEGLPEVIQLPQLRRH